MAKESEQGLRKRNTDLDYFPTIGAVASMLKNQVDDPDARVRRLEVRFGSNGHGTLRYWSGRDQEWSVRPLTNPDSP